METDKKTIGTAVIALLISLGSLGVNLSEPSELENYYICDVNLQTGEFARLSSTFYTAYPNELNNAGRVRCINEEGNKGKWLKLLDYMDENNINIDDIVPLDDENKELIDNEVNYIQAGKSYKCNQIKCEEIK